MIINLLDFRFLVFNVFKLQLHFIVELRIGGILDLVQKS